MEVLSNRKALLAVLLLILLGLGLRVYSLASPSLWLDEAVSANIAKSSVAEYLQWAREDFHPPLYYLLLHFWSSLGHDEFTLRLFSVMTNCLSGIILYSCVRSMFNPSTALLALLLFTLSPFQVRYSQEVRMYSLLGLWIVSILFFTFRYLNDRSWPSLFGYILSSTLGLYTHYHAGVFLIVLNAAVVISLCRTGKARLWPWVLAQCAIFLLFIPWLPHFIQRFKGGGLSWFPFHPSFALLLSPLFSFLWGDLILSKAKHLLGPFVLGAGGLGSAVQWALGLASILFLWVVWKKLSTPTPSLPLQRGRVRVGVFLLAGMIGFSYGLSFRSNIYGAKYLFGASFIVYILVAIFLASLIQHRRKTGIALALLVIVTQVLMLAAYYQPRNYRENWRGAVEYIETHSIANQAVGFHFDTPMAPYVFYARTSIPVLGLLKGGSPSPSLGEVSKERYEGIWLFDYLAELYDPGGAVKKTLSERGYVPVWSHNFNGVPLSLWK